MAVGKIANHVRKQIRLNSADGPTSLDGQAQTTDPSLPAAGEHSNCSNSHLSAVDALKMNVCLNYRRTKAPGNGIGLEAPHADRQ